MCNVNIVRILLLTSTQLLKFLLSFCKDYAGFLQTVTELPEKTFLRGAGPGAAPEAGASGWAVLNCRDSYRSLSLQELAKMGVPAPEPAVTNPIFCFPESPAETCTQLHWLL